MDYTYNVGVSESAFRRIAQLVERRSPKPQVVSSRLTAPVSGLCAAVRKSAK